MAAVTAMTTMVVVVPNFSDRFGLVHSRYRVFEFRVGSGFFPGSDLVAQDSVQQTNGFRFISV
ncbi:hypothetical protein Hanom_Chr02g00128621 [Helianthus anomalus]